MLSDKFLVFLPLLVLFAVLQETALAIKKPYVVYLGGHSHGPEATPAELRQVEDLHAELLASLVGSEERAKDAMIYSYKRYINGFSAVLEEEEAAELAQYPDVVSVFPSQGKKLHTTHSWDFLMLERDGKIHPSSLWKKARYGEDTIIANLDSGVWPESHSFSDKGYGPTPSKWKGVCQSDEFDDKSLCNRKLIGARYFNKGYASYVGKLLNATYNTSRDTDGHGTHTLSTAAGNFVPGASVFGVVNGTAKGGSPGARVAAYRVCYPPVDGNECFDNDILEGFEMAIHDGVDVISVSLGGAPEDYFNDGIAIGAFHAVKNGRVVVASAGNDGPTPGSVTNVAPWMITVAASTMDRLFQANVKLETGELLEGTSFSKAMPQNKLYPFISAARARAANVSERDAILCKDHTLDPKKAEGKVVVCLRGVTARVEKGVEALRAGAVGMVLCNDKTDGNDIIADPHVLPATHVNYAGGLIIFNYVNHTRNPTGIIMPVTTGMGVKPAPTMASFSSRGPNPLTAEILKPDITAPGVNIIAAYSEAVTATFLPSDTRTTPFNVDSGTSMACPHVSGVAGLLRTLYPDWTPGAIRSAIMTTARTRDDTVHPMKDSDMQEASAFAYGSGHVRPNRAMDPGLVYDLTVKDYLDFLCGLGYNETLISQFSGTTHNCPHNYSVLNFNNPAITVQRLSGSVTVSRTLKNVGKPATYAAKIRAPSGYSVSIEPRVLKFEKIGEEKTFRLTIKARSAKGSSYEFGHLKWTDGSHYVRSPIAVAQESTDGSYRSPTAVAQVSQGRRPVVHRRRSIY